ncbi:bifunctional [glutamate--ammonia ligase]-adenylyl-L-tyrosine phosphorylase/[glutamate--ammonia-ligase] adenylyltransferase [Nevskia soli]|uniref:bifunctional [glutamate--ammonia ligase]-adenylyl-L-tyrosine phosphorylase/[glutamate--ammonia-ligase] adenylyltransferase n=1 Tax=Nevskia soli TaxID=418856 RepID=UPI0004A6D5A5|nr:bifunctional [glutamate--ammonia ligase]-adenylyl-L-tyrosine phosphorylase/[glutamate--ammonia-ligase] adenylyltransferase [Nevskia soli]
MDILSELQSVSPAGIAALLPRVFRASPFVAGIFARQQDWAKAALAGGELEQAPVLPVAERLDATLAGAADEAAVMRELRAFRNREMARIAVRDIAGWAGLDETLRALSDLADASCESALRFAAGVLQARHGVPRDEDGAEARPIVLGMGKLGGRELNFSSDIDLIFVFTGNGDTDGSRPVSNAEYFARLAQDTGKLLSTRTADGFVFRVDTLLRPFGSVGAPAVSMDAMEMYYQQHGREWERYAMIKARPVAGDLEAGQQLLQGLRPFVYRRYLDFGALGALRELKAMIDQDAHKRGAEDNLKLGPGGIRELEFIVQLFQLIRGGQDARLRDNRLRPVLHYLGEAGHLPPETVAALDQAYVFLRRSENAVQMYADEQTHRLPQAQEAREALCAALDIDDGWAGLLLRLDPLRVRVRAEFERLFAQPVAGTAHAPSAVAEDLWQDEGEELEATLRGLGFVQRPQDVARSLQDLRQSRQVRALKDAARPRLQAVLGALVHEAVTQADPEEALIRTLRVLAAIVGRSTYLALLAESLGARRQLLKLCGASPWIVDLLAQTPALLDTLLDARLANEAPDRAALREELRRRAAGVPAAEAETVMDLLRGYRQEMTLRIAAADLSGALPLVQVSDRLTWLAEAIVAQALDYAREQLAPQLGTPPGGDDDLALIAYGKFGSIELGYGSDLDLVFVYQAEDPDAGTGGGTRSVAASEYFVRLVQRVVQLLSARTVAGRAYEIDLQLRPSGNSGLVVTGLAGFARYQRESAWTWEHQALLRARSVAGGAPLCAAIEAIRREVLMRPRDAGKLRAEVVEMRAKMRASLEKRQVGRWDVKQGGGGLIDAEFITQYLCLRHAAQHAGVVEYTDNWRQLEALAAAGLVEAPQKDALLAAERAYRGWLHRRSLQSQDALADDADLKEHRAAVSALWNHFMLGESI